MSRKIITIDGPAGSGKSTVAAILARKRGLLHLNSGLLYRAAGLKAAEINLSFEDDEKLSQFVSEVEFKFSLKENGETEFSLGDESLNQQVGSEEAGDLASKIAVLPGVREVLTTVQRNVAAEADDGVVVEGRDAGTAVFPDADFKFYLNASLGERAKRRFEGLVKEGDSETKLQEVKEDILERDSRDKSRKHAPLEASSDAYLIDSEGLSVEEVVEKLEEIAFS